DSSTRLWVVFSCSLISCIRRKASSRTAAQMMCFSESSSACRYKNTTGYASKSENLGALRSDSARRFAASVYPLAKTPKSPFGKVVNERTKLLASLIEPHGNSEKLAEGTSATKALLVEGDYRPSIRARS